MRKAILNRFILAALGSSLLLAGCGGGGGGSDVNLNTGLIHWWKFDGDANDSVGTLNGTVVGPMTYQPAVVGQGITGDGVTTGVEFPAAANMQFQSSFSISVWVSMKAYHPEHLWSSIFFDGDDRNGDDPFALQVDGFGNFSFQVMGASDFVSLSLPLSMRLNQFVLITGTYDQRAGVISLYQNGRLVSQKSKLPNLTPVVVLDPTQNPGMGIGNCNAFPTGGYNFGWDGTIDDLRVYNRALSAREVTALYNQVIPI